MATAKTAMAQLLLCEESTWGTTPGTPSTYKLPISGLSGDWFRKNFLQNPEIRGTRNPAAPVLGNQAVQGQFQIPLHYEPFGWIQKHAIGTPDSSGSGPYVHESKVNFSGSTEGGDLPVGLTLEVGFTDEDLYFPYTGCKVSTLALQATSEGVAVFTVGIIGRGLTTPSATSIDASPTEYTDSVVDHSDLAIEEGGSSSAIIESINFTLDNGLDDSLYCIGGAGLKADLPTGIASLTGQLTALFQDLTLFNKALNSTESSIKLTFTTGTSSLELFIPEVLFEPRAPEIGAAGVRVTLPFQAYYGDNSDSTVLMATLTNGVTSY